jgi:hypothetical protein
MSFSAMFAGRAAEVREALDVTPNPSFRHGGDLGMLVQQFLSEVAALVPDDRRLIVESSGHGDSSSVSVNIRVASVWDFTLPAESHAAASTASGPNAGTPEG